MPFKRIHPASALAGGTLLFYPLPCFAQATALVRRIEELIFPDVMDVMAGVVLLFVFYYGFRLVLESQNESAITDAKKAFINSLFGFAVLATWRPIRTAFLRGNPQTPINTDILHTDLDGLIAFIIIAVQGVFVLLLVFHGLRILASQGEEGEVEKARKGIIQNIVGVLIMAFARVIVVAVGTNDPSVIGWELVGIAQFVIGLIGAVSVLALIIAGVVLIVSVDESLKEKAKRIVTGTIIAIFIALVSYVAIDLFAIAPNL